MKPFSWTKTIVIMKQCIEGIDGFAEYIIKFHCIMFSAIENTLAQIADEHPTNVSSNVIRIILNCFRGGSTSVVWDWIKLVRRPNLRKGALNYEALGICMTMVEQ